MSHHGVGGLPYPYVVGTLCSLPFPAIMLQVLVWSLSPKAAVPLLLAAEPSGAQPAHHMGPQRASRSPWRGEVPWSKGAAACCLLHHLSGQV